MKIAAGMLGVFCGLCLLSTGFAQDCSSLGFGNTIATIVGDLPAVCTDPSLRASPQCCSVQYINDRVNATRESFLVALREEIRVPFGAFRSIADITVRFLDNNFVSGLFSSFGSINFLTNSRDVIQRYSEELINNFDISVDVNGQTFEVSEFFDRYINEIKEAAISQYASLPGEDIRQCIRNLIQNNIDETRQNALAAALEILRRIRTSIDKLTTFLDDFEADLQNFTPLDECVNRLVDVVDCGSCLGEVRPLCFNWCGALARACYSPFHQAIGAQFGRFWTEARRILDELPNVWADLNQNRRVLGASGLVQGFAECGFEFPNSSGKRQATDNNPLLPNLPSLGLDNLPRIGLISYLTQPRFCTSSFVQTANSRCRNGEMNEGDDIEPFTSDDIMGQVSNPAIQVDQAELEAQASALGSPVDTFLDSTAYASTAPGGGSLGLTATISLLIVSLVIALSLN